MVNINKENILEYLNDELKWANEILEPMNDMTEFVPRKAKLLGKIEFIQEMMSAIKKCD